MRLLRRKGTRVGAGLMPAAAAFFRVRAVGMTLVMALATAPCLLAAGCAPGADYPPYPSIFPSAHDGPPPRTDTPMSAVEVQKATEDLITDRDRLNAQAPSSQGQGTGRAAASATMGAKTAATGKIKNKAAKRAPQRTAAVPQATAASAQGAGMQTAGSDPKP